MSPDGPNLVAVSIDSLRGDHCGYLGDERGLTPALDRLAADGVAYRTAVAAGPQTFSSMPAVMTGRQRRPTTLEEYPRESHWERRLAALDDHLRHHATLAERLRDLGYDTAAITPNPWTSSAAGFDRGFDVFEEPTGRESTGLVEAVADRFPGVDPDSRPVELVSNVLSGSEFFARWRSLTDRIERARAELTEPYFLWVFVLDTHFPFFPSRPHREEQSVLGMYYGGYRSADAMRGNGGGMSERVRRSVRRSYRDTVREADAFLEYLRETFGDDDPTVIVHSDHGESFGDHDRYGHHHRRVFEENVHVPYIVSGTGVEADVDEPVSLASVFDTTLEIARTGTFDPWAPAEPAVVATSECGSNRAVRGRRFKYVETADDDRLFDLEHDPDEQRDVTIDRPERCREARRRLATFERHRAERTRLARAAAAVASSERV